MKEIATGTVEMGSFTRGRERERHTKCQQLLDTTRNGGKTTSTMSTSQRRTKKKTPMQMV